MYTRLEKIAATIEYGLSDGNRNVASGSIERVDIVLPLKAHLIGAPNMFRDVGYTLGKSLEDKPSTFDWISQCRFRFLFTEVLCCTLGYQSARYV